MKLIFYSILTILSFIFIVSCEKPPRNNPWDEMANLNPTAWAPQNLQIEDVTITEKKLTWTYGSQNIEGFKIDRQKSGEPLQTAYQTLPKEAREWTDKEIIPDSTITYAYSVYAYAGNYTSAEQNVSASATIPPPENFQITPNSATSVTLSWDYNQTGHDGFKIDRKIDNGSWDMLVDNLNPNQNSFIDQGLELPEYYYRYRIYVFLGATQSIYAEELVQYVLSIGEFYKGGLVFFSDGSGGGLVCAESDQSINAGWGCYGATIGGTGTGIRMGASNTTSILAGCGEIGIAARICDELVLNGYDDWFLPSKDELNLMYENLKVAGFGGFAYGSLWSSSEYSDLTAWGQYFGNGSQNGTYKGSTYYVRAVRAF